MSTHEVLNQPPPLVDYNLFTSDRALVAAAGREAGSWAMTELTELGAKLGRAEVQAWAALAHTNPPILHTHDRFGHRIDEVEFHPAYHELMRLSIGHGLHAQPWRDPRQGAHAARGAKMILTAGLEFGHLCPVSMTYSCVPALRRAPDVLAEWQPRLSSLRYDGRARPAAEKDGATIGMAMTEKQGGSDVRANTTRAERDGDGWRLTGHKWFCSAPMCDGFLVLAQTGAGLSCFFMPRWTPDGERNAIRLMRLKDKLGNRSNASSEIELEGAWAQLVGEEGRGVPTIIEMANHTRLDCVLASTGMIRQATTQALHHAAHRSAFGQKLAAQPLMRNVLADLAVESDAALVLALRLARAYDGQESGDPHRPFRRIATAIAKFWICKRASSHVAEALECLGGNGFVEDSGLPRIYREAPLNSIWEGSGNVICLDVLRALQREPGSWEALLGELRAAKGADARLDAAVRSIESERVNVADLETGARRFVERLALALQASLLVRHAEPAVADAFCASRLGGDWGRVYGTLAPGVDTAKIVAGAMPLV
jgi:putative acyl-CoA dehydrogenase